MRARFVSLLLIGVLLACAAPAAQAAASPEVSLSRIRAVRISTSTISLSFVTNIPAVGKLDYVAFDGSEITLTDSAAQVDHLFTVDELSSTHDYSFVLTARKGDVASYQYVVSLSPESIGNLGQSLMPAVRVTQGDGTVIATVPVSTTTPASASSPVPWWLLVFLVVVAGVGWTISRLPREKTPPQKFPPPPSII